MVKITRDGSGKTRVAKGDQSGLGGQYAPDPAKIESAKNRIAELETLDEPASIDWKKYYPTPTFREFNSVEITVNGEYMYSDDLVDHDSEDGFNRLLASEIETAFLEYDEFDIEIVHVPNHVEPEWKYSDIQVPQKFLMKNRKFNQTEQEVLNNIVDTTKPVNIASQNLNTFKMREIEGVTQIQWNISVPIFEEEEFVGEEILQHINEYNDSFQNLHVSKKQGFNILHFSGWHTVNNAEKNILKKLSQ
jgi:hypothetical protein